MAILDFHIHYSGNIEEAERFADKWRAAGVEKGVVFALNHQDGSHTTVEEIEALVKRVPDFYIPFGYVMPGFEDGVAEVRKAKERGFKGMKIMYPSKPYDDDEFFPLYEEIAKAGMACLFHTGIVVGNSRPGEVHGVEFHKPFRISSNYMRPMHLDRIARAFPEMPIVGAHVGAESWYEEATSMFEWLSNIYFDLAIGQFHYVKKNAPAGSERRVIKMRIQELYDCGQLDLRRIIYGSDGCVGVPSADPSHALSTLEFEMKGLGATEAEKEAVSWGTAARILGL